MKITFFVFKQTSQLTMCAAIFCRLHDCAAACPMAATARCAAHPPVGPRRRFAVNRAVVAVTDRVFLERRARQAAHVRHSGNVAVALLFTSATNS